MFGNIIRTFRINNGLSQAMFVELLQRSSCDFFTLDVVTLSRWERGVTNPHLKRQNEILDLIGVNIFDIWMPNEPQKLLDKVTSKFNTDSYIGFNMQSTKKVITINSNNLFILREIPNLIDIIFDYEENILLDNMESTGLSRVFIIEKIINKYMGEINIVTVNGQIVGHLLSANYKLAKDFFDPILVSKEDRPHLIVSFNCFHSLAVIDTIGRELFKYLQRTNPDKKIYILLNNNRMLGILVSLGFEFRNIKVDDKIIKLMMLNSKKIKSSNDLMSITKNYKEKKSGQKNINC
ncbi:hypothetical protein AKJ18_19830 [Vibrio xuii]|nr:hypothetical protein AKJ18_19830 [Vibrio xuii]